MARPRVFISSTYYDLKHVRASLEIFIEGLGFEPVLAEFGSIAYDPTQPLDESCYREAETADILVLIVGGRYGSISSAQAGEEKEQKETELDSITRKEFTKAHDSDIPVFVLIENGVFSEYQTYLKNKEASNIRYAHVDSVQVFKFIEFVYSKQRNNPIQSFEKGSDIEGWLRDQWAGIFQDLLRQKKDNKAISALSAQISQLEAVNATLKSYLETVLQTVSPDQSVEVIERENKSLSRLKMLEKLLTSTWYSWLMSEYPNESTKHIDVMASIKSINDVIPRITEEYHSCAINLLEALVKHNLARKDFNSMREIMGLTPVNFTQSFYDDADLKIKHLKESS